MSTTRDGASPARRWVRWAPAALGALFAGIGLVAFVAASQGLRLTVGPAEAPSTAADPLALVRDDVSALQRALDELGGAIGGGLESLDAQAARRHEALERRVDDLDRRLGRLLEQQQALSARLDGSPASGAAGAAEPAPIASETPDAPRPAGAPAARPGLFSFKAPGLDLDERLRFQVLPSLSRVGFDARSTLHDFTGVTSDVEGWLEARLAAPADARAEIVAKAATLRTGVDGRDEELRERLETGRHADLRFVMTGFTGARVDREARTIAGDARGEMTIHGVTRPIVVPVRASIDASRRLVLEGEVAIAMSAFGVEPPDLGVIVVEDRVRMWLSLRLRSVGEAGQEAR